MIDCNTVGDRGEAMFFLAISKLHGERPLFRPAPLGGKWPTADLIVELDDESGMFFLVQVKTSKRGYTKDKSRLFISAEKDKLQALADAPVPTYLVGVDEPGERVYLTPVHGTISKGRSSISVQHSPQVPNVRERLYDEVRSSGRRFERIVPGHPPSSPTTQASLKSMNENEPWFIGQRAELLASVTFTRLPDVIVRQQTTDDGLDLLVSLPADKGGRVFGVRVKGARHRDTYVTKEGRIRDQVVQQLDKTSGDSPFPVGIAVFDMSDDSGYFGWLLAPGESDTGTPKLERRQSVAVSPITMDELNKIVHDVKHWYDLRAGTAS